ncbi:MAG: hypothetical protein H0X50_10855 [Nitrosopumilus sp.]|nr:hypothetical protein [Nitrosopumilus sp.]
MPKKIDRTFIRRRWLDFRNGHSIYLIFLLTFTNFILITYNFAIKQMPFGIGDYLNLPVFVVLFALLYVPVAIVLGVWHRKHQYSVENEALLRQNWMWAWVMQYQIRLIKGKTNPKEDEYIITYLNDILKRTNKSELVGEDIGSVIPIPKEEKLDTGKNN